MRSWRSFTRCFGAVLALCPIALVRGCGKDPITALYINNKEEMERNAKLETALQRVLAVGTNAEIQARAEFLEVWPSAWTAHGWTFDKQREKFNGGTATAALLYDRYVIKLILDWEAPADLREFRFVKLRYNFYEIESVRLAPGGGTVGGQYITYNSTNQAWFGAKQWKSLAESNWDFSQLGVHVVSNAPVPNIRTLAPGRW